MAGDWIKMEVNLPDKPEVWRIAGMLGCDADSVVGKLLRVWAWFDAHTEDGNAAGVSFPLVDRIAGVAGFAEAMALCGWLLQDGHNLSLPRFDRHNGKTAKNRALTNDRVAKHRKSSNAACNADTVTKSVTREEKRREYSVAKATGAEAPGEDDEKRELYEAGKSLLQSRGMPKPQCGSFIGKLAKDYGQAVALEAVRAAVGAQPMDAAEYLKATCQRLKGERKDPVTVPCTDTRADEFKAQMEQRAREATKPPAEVLALIKRKVGA